MDFSKNPKHCKYFKNFAIVNILRLLDIVQQLSKSLTNFIPPKDPPLVRSGTCEKQIKINMFIVAIYQTLVQKSLVDLATTLRWLLKFKKFYEKNFTQF